MPPAVKPAAVRIRLPYPTIPEFAEGYRHHLSRAAAFVATETPRTVGSLLQFEFVLQGGEQVLRGEAVVARETSPQSRPGMLLRFLSLDEASRELLESICPALEGSAEAPVLGLDFGSSGVRVAVVRRGKPEPLLLGRERSISTAVAADAQGRLLVGQRAQAMALTQPERVVLGLKRLLGRRSAQDGKSLSARLPFPLAVDQRGELAAVLAGAIYPMPRLAAEILRTVRERAQEALGGSSGQPLQRAVIAVPAHFRDRQRAALRRAASEAGFSVERLINESSAVALACSFGRGFARRRLAIVDLGGGAFDCSVVQVEGDEVETLACGGDSRFGGLEFDLRLANFLAERFEAESGQTLVDDAQAFQRLLDAAAAAKVALSAETEVGIDLPALTVRDQTPLDFRTKLARTELEALTADLVDRVVHLTSEVLRAGKLAPRDCDELILVGGLSAMPLLRARLSELFGQPPRPDFDGESAVACGAALLGFALTEREQSLGLAEALSAALWVELGEGELREIFARHTLLPAEQHLTLDSKGADVRGCRVRIHQGPAGATEVLGTLEIAPRGLEGTTDNGQPLARPQLILSLSADGVLHVLLKLGGQERSLDLLPADARSELPLASVEGLLQSPRALVSTTVSRTEAGAGA